MKAQLKILNITINYPATNLISVSRIFERAVESKMISAQPEGQTTISEKPTALQISDNDSYQEVSCLNILSRLFYGT